MKEIKLWSTRPFPGGVPCKRYGGYEITPTALANAKAARRRSVTLKGRTLPREVEVGWPVLNEAQQLAAWAAKRWGVPMPAVKFFSRAERPDAKGIFFPRSDPGSIWIRSDQHGGEFMGTIFHEVSHYARKRLDLSNTEADVDTDMARLTVHHTHEMERLKKWATYEY